MTRLLSASFATLFVAALAAPASAHEGAGVVHFMSQPDHVAGLILAVAAPLVVWVLARRVRNRR
jgi:hypothetical protein